MKKLVLAALAVAVLAGTSFAAADLKVKVGGDFLGKSSAGGASADLNTGITAAAEFLFAVSDGVKVGPAVSYGLAREFSDNNPAQFQYSYLSTYATVEVAPFEKVKGLFFKGNIGLGITDLSSGLAGVIGSTSESGLYFGIGAGYELANGIFFDALYGSHGFEGGSSSKITVSAGYKFAL
ncbi:outer membrane beta-barrel protein [Endomicrobium proavitum]|uniref:Outer membrane protein beta-barrel domain-containing protein n=1 Tax=Endomicrobium proavitum TaxID=1408281 RepID=A0A0G3WM63_9BACT|nr:outer membrane beta-barrel protein [Endomicrobium proavitum]AKL98564.1 exported protein of unknown function [Endomicrobium proavitum]